MAVYHVALFANDSFSILERVASFCFEAPSDASASRLHSLALAQAVNVPTSWCVALVETFSPDHKVSVAHFVFLNDDFGR